MQHRNADPKDYIKAFDGIDFPASRAGIIRAAQDKGGLNGGVDYVLQQIEDRTYESVDDVAAEVNRILAAGGGLDGGTPAAASEITTPEKDLIQTMADPRRGEPRS